MKTLILSIAFTLSCGIANAQVNSGSISVPNTGVNPTTPPMPTYTSPSDNLSNPTNSTVPGANGSYSVDPGKPSLTSPNTGTFTSPATFPPGTPSAPTTYTPQSRKKSD